jgi:hypothetical protein
MNGVATYPVVSKSGSSSYQGTFFGVRVGRVHPKNVPAVRLGLEHEVHGIETGDDRAARLTGAVATVCYSVLQLVL